MSVATFPDVTRLPGLTWSITRTPSWSTLRQQKTSGRENRVALWSNPLWKWQLQYDYLRHNPNLRDEDGKTQLEWLAGFYLSQQGMYGQFLFNDPTDNAVQGQPLGLGDGATTQFQLRRQFGDFTEIIQAPAGTPTVYLNGVATAAFTMSSAGLITFTSAPASGVNISADFEFNWPVRFGDDSYDFDNFLYQLWTVKKITLQQVRL